MRKHLFKLLYLVSIFVLLVQSASAQYTLTDEDVVVSNGIIDSCSYTFDQTQIIIPATLDGQSVTGIASAEAKENGVFYDKKITSVQFPASIEVIGDHAFNRNVITSIDLSTCISITTIGEYAFFDNQIASLNLTGCNALSAINEWAFGYNQLTLLDLSSCTSLTNISGHSFRVNLISSIDFSNCINIKTIDAYAFTNNKITSLDLSALTGLTSMGRMAFSSNSITTVNLSGCTLLTKIGSKSFFGNSLSSIALPTVSGYESIGWKDEDGNAFASGASVSNFDAQYWVPFGLYTLTDNDVVISDGIIVYSHSLPSPEIVIPASLDGQDVKGFSDENYTDGIFYGAGIVSVKLSATLEYVGENAFRENFIETVDLSACANLTTVKNSAFYKNKITTIDFSACSSLKTIESSAFAQNLITNLDFSACSSLSVIGFYAFSENEISSLNIGTVGLTKIEDFSFSSNALTQLDFSASTNLTKIGKYAFNANDITSLNFTNCTKLKSIGSWAFTQNDISNVDLSACSGLIKMGEKAFTYNNAALTGFTLPVNVENADLGWFDTEGTAYTGNDVISNLDLAYYVPVAAYTLTDADVDMVNGELNGNLTLSYVSIIIPDTLQGQAVTQINGAAYLFNGLVSIQFPATLIEIKKRSFYNDNLTHVDFSRASSLTTIGEEAFISNKIKTIEFSGCTSLEEIYSKAFYQNDIDTLDITACKSLTDISTNAFGINHIENFILPVIEGHEMFGWAIYSSNSGTKFAEGGDTITYSTYNHYYVPEPKTIDDDDVIVTDGMIVNYDPGNYGSSMIIIPDTLDGQEVIGIADGSKYNTGVFYGKNLTFVQVPNSLKHIGNYAFYYNSISKFYLQEGTQLQYIGDSAFQVSSLTKFSFELCDSLVEIGAYAFAKNNLTTVDFSKCKKLKTIGNEAFFYNDISNIDLTQCAELVSIEKYAFEDNELDTIDITNCNKLMSIGKGAFRDNNITTFTLPVNSMYADLGWQNEDGDISVGGDTVPKIYDSYIVPAPYVLTDGDVVVVEGVIDSCYYNFDNVNILIPDNLDGQVVIGICNKYSSSSDGPFYKKGIVSVTLPSTIETIGTYAFYNNDIRHLDLSNCTKLKSIGYCAFYNYPMKSLSFKGCVSLETIGKQAFASTKIDDVNFEGCSNLQTISEKAFDGTNIVELNLNDCVNLETIGKEAFTDNKIDSLNLNLCKKLKTIGQQAFSGNNIRYVGVNDCSDLTMIETMAFYNNTDELIDFVLPTPSVDGYTFNNWYNNLSEYNGGDTVGIFTTYYKAKLTFYGFTVDFSVTDISSNAFEGATVIFGDSTFVTDATGLHQIDSLGTGTYNYTVTADGYKTITDAAVIIDEHLALNLVMENCIDHITKDSSICDGESVVIGINTYSTSGEYENVFTNQFGCDSVFTLNLTVIKLETPTVSYNSADTILTSTEAEGYQWYLNGRVIYGAVEQTYIPTDDGNYSVIVYQGSCSSAASEAVKVQLTEILYTVTFKVTDSNNLKLTGATVVFDGTEFTTPGYGDLSINSLSVGTYNYSVSNTGYKTVNGSVEVVDDNVTKTVALESCIDEIVLDETICTGDSIAVGGNYYLATGTYEIMLTNEYNCDSIITLNLTLASLEAPTATYDEASRTLSSSAAEGNQWYLNGVAITDATAQTLVPTENGNYSVIVSQGSCSSEESNVVSVVLSSISSVTESALEIYPNPASSSVTIKGVCGRDVIVISANGTVVKRYTQKDNDLLIDVSNFESGIYFVKCNQEVHQLSIVH